VRILKDLAGHPDWMALIKAVEQMRPQVPSWDANTDNTEDWKRKSAMQEGFDLCFQAFTDKLPK